MDQQAVTRLIDKSIHGDQFAFRRLVETHQQLVWSVAFRLLGENFETEEVVQEAFVRVWKNLDRFKKGMRFSTWLYKIITNLCFDKLKAKKVRNRYMAPLSDYEDAIEACSGDNPEKEFSNREQASIIRVLTETLSPRQKLVFVLSDLEELSTEEITSITGMSALKIKSNLYCARKEIRNKLIEIEKIKRSYEI